MSNFYFSTGVLSVTLASNVSYSGSDVVGALQSAEFSAKCDMKTVKEAQTVTLYPVADAEHNWQVTLKLDCVDLAEALIPYTTGAVKTVSGSNDIYTHSGTNTPQYVRIKIVGTLSDGRPATLEILRAKAPGMALAMKIDDFTNPSIEFTVLPTLGSTAWTLTIGQ